MNCQAYNDEGKIIQARHAREFSAAVEIAKEMEESTPAWTSSRRKVRYFHDGSGGDRMKSRPMSNGMNESEKDARNDVKPKSPLPWMTLWATSLERIKSLLLSRFRTERGLHHPRLQCYPGQAQRSRGSGNVWLCSTACSANVCAITTRQRPGFLKLAGGSALNRHRTARPMVD